MWKTRAGERTDRAKVKTMHDYRQAHTKTDGTWDTYQDVEFRAGHELNQPGQEPRVNHLADALVAAVGEVGEGPADVRENLVVLVLQEVEEDGQHLLHGFFARVRGPCSGTGWTSH